MGNNLFAAFAYGSRGLLWASLAGEIIASMLEGEPLPVERKLAAAVAPDRFLLRQKKQAATAARA
jgi:tRNA 5-methylaminomethyl-2-thiouridine biosynthesis bifunctional protein